MHYIADSHYYYNYTVRPCTQSLDAVCRVSFVLYPLLHAFSVIISCARQSPSAMILWYYTQHQLNHACYGSMLIQLMLCVDRASVLNLLSVYTLSILYCNCNGLYPRLFCEAIVCWKSTLHYAIPVIIVLFTSLCCTWLIVQLVIVIFRDQLKC